MFLILLMAVLNGCCKQTPTVQTITEYKVLKPPASLLTPCPEVPLEMKTNGDMVMTLIDLNTQYLICSMKIRSIISYYEQENLNME